MIDQMIAYRGFSSAEKFAEQFQPRRLSGMTIRRICDGEDPQIGTRDGDVKLTRLSGMLGLPPATLRHVREGDVEGVEQLPWGDEDQYVRAFIVETMRPRPDPGRQRRRSNG